MRSPGRSWFLLVPYVDIRWRNNVLRAYANDVVKVKDRFKGGQKTRCVGGVVMIEEEEGIPI